MSETQKGTLLCPECGAPISAVLQQLTGWAHFHGRDGVELAGRTICPDALSYCDWTGHTEINWDSQMDHPGTQVMCDNRHVVNLENCSFEPSAPEAFPYVEAILTCTRVWKGDEYLDFCKKTNKVPTADGFAGWARYELQGSDDPIWRDDTYSFSVELKRRSDF